MNSTNLSRFVRYSQAKTFVYEAIKSRLPEGLSEEDESISINSITEVCEFFYMLSVTDIRTGAELEALALAHNATCYSLLQREASHLRTIGLTPQKIKDALFSDKNIKKLSANYEIGDMIDQSDISRLLFQHMSRESVRKILVLLGRAGLVKRLDAGDSVLLGVTPSLVTLFDDYLEFLVGDVVDS